MKSSTRTFEDNKKAQLENEIARLKKKVARYEAIELKQNNFGLVWLPIPEAFEDDVENKLPILEEVPKQAINSKDGKPTHLLIEGDNYHALTCLNYTHKGKIDVIYIDPPYNTGSDGFKYKDKRFLKEYPDGTEVPVDHPLRHSYWLSFMHKRLELANNLLKDTGVILISIDDNEIAQLKLLCDEIFNPDNFVDILAVQMSTAQGEKIRAAKKGSIVKNTEFCLIYCKNKNKQIVKNLLYDPTRYDSHYSKFLTKIDENTYKITGLGEEALKDEKIKKELEILDLLTKGKLTNGNIAEAYELSKEFHSFIIENKDKVGRIHDFVTLKAGEKISNKLDKGYAVKFQSKERGYIVVKNGQKFYQVITLEDKINRADDFYNTLTTTSIRGDWWSGFYLDMGNVNKEGGITLDNGKKPVRLIKQLIKWVSEKNALVLDFFAGSGTTGQAVMELNEEDGGSRQFILNTNNENNIMFERCYPRIQNVIKGYNNTGGLGNSIKYFKTAFVGKNNILKADDADKIDLAHNVGGMLAIAENTFERIEENNYWQIFENEKQFTAMYFREEFNKFDHFVERVKKLKKPAVVYIFSWEKEFEFTDFDDEKNIRIKTIPQPILEIYKEIYNLV